MALGLCIQSNGAVAGAQCGRASWYATGSETASGERMDAGQLAAAHRSLPFGTLVKVENVRNGKAVVVRINDRGPFVRGRVIDVTRAAAIRLGMIAAGVAQVRVTVVDGKSELASAC
ncbi:MAG: septal ring lytic transglycosylase RlpA family protein [Bauldia sp.]